MSAGLQIPHRLSTLAAVRTALPPTLFWLMVAALILFMIPERGWDMKRQGLIALGLFGLWRYSWQVLHGIRHIIYARIDFPLLRNRAQNIEDPWPRRVYLVIPSYFELSAVSRLVFQALSREAASIPSKVTAVVAVGSNEEAEFINNVVENAPGGEHLRLLFMYQSQGKRVAMGHALRAISRDWSDFRDYHDEAEDDLIVFMDGDTYLDKDFFHKTLPYFKLPERFAALTTDNLGLCVDRFSAMQQFFNLKFAQRNHQFQSHSLSRRVLTLTGRCSVYRAGIVLNEDFIRHVEADYLDHWLFGRFRFLMGDDKSTLYWIMAQGHEMLYIPDAKAVALESRQGNFFRITLSLMQRWYGNMLRNNSRTIALGPRKLGFFIWWCVIDQRLTSWTPLVGPITALMLTFFVNPFFLAFYISWVIFTRLVMLWAYVLEGMPLATLHLPMMLYGQWVGATMKLFTSYNLSDQKWSKTDKAGEQHIGERRNTRLDFLRDATKSMFLVRNSVLLVFLCGVMTGSLWLPSEVTSPIASLNSPRSVTAANVEPHTVLAMDFGLPMDGVSDAAPALARALAEAKDLNSRSPDNVTTEPVTIQLPPGRFMLASPLHIEQDNVRLLGAGAESTWLVSTIKAAQGVSAILVGGDKGPQVGALAAAAKKGDAVLISDTAVNAPWIWLGHPNDESFLRSIDSRVWNKEYPWLRQQLAQVVGFGKQLRLKRGLTLDMPADSEIRQPRLVSNVHLKGFSLTQRAGTLTPEDAFRKYENLAPQFAVDGIRFDWAAECSLANITITMAGRHSLVFENCLDVHAENLIIDGSWNKGRDGNGYVKFSRAYHCSLSESTIKNVRHLAFQWSAAGNSVSKNYIMTDVNFHGGYSHDNIVSQNVISPPETHKWGRIWRMPPGGAHFAPPDGPGNVVF